MPERFSWLVGRRFFAAGSRSRLASFISVLAVTGLVMGVALLILVLSVMNGFEREMRTRILGVVPHIQFFGPGGIEHWRDTAARLSTHPQVVQVTPFTRFQGMVNHRGNITAVSVQGLLPGAMDGALKATLPADVEKWLGDGKLALSRNLADKLGVRPGDTLTLIAPRPGRGRQGVPVMRVMELGGVFSTHTAEDNVLALLHLDSAGAITGLGGRPQGLRVRVDRVFDARQTGYELLDRLPRGFTFVDWLQTHGNLYQAIQMSRQLVGLLIFLIIAIAVFNVVSMLVMTVTDKRPAIAILKTLGAGNGDIIAIFLVQGTLIGLLGTGLGVAVGSAGALWVSEAVAWLENALQFRFLSAQIYPIDYVPADLRGTDIAVVAATALGLNFLATLYPAWKAARTRPAEILRYE